MSVLYTCYTCVTPAGVTKKTAVDAVWAYIYIVLHLLHHKSIRSRVRAFFLSRLDFLRFCVFSISIDLAKKRCNRCNRCNNVKSQRDRCYTVMQHRCNRCNNVKSQRDR